MKFSWVSFSEDSSTRLYQMCGQILTFLEKKHNMVTTSNRISCMSIHWVITTSQPNQTEKKKHYSGWLLSITCTRVTVPASPF